MKFTNSEILAICKILLDSRAFTKKGNGLHAAASGGLLRETRNHQLVRELIQNEQFYYVQPQHNTVFVDTMWSIGEAIQNCHYIEIEYRKMKGQEVVRRKLKPVSIIFSNFIFIWQRLLTMRTRSGNILMSSMTHFRQSTALTASTA